MNKTLLKIITLLLAIALVLSAGVQAAETPANTKQRPNIVWIVVDDMSSHFGYQGEKLVKTPHVDQLAREGVAFSNAYVTAPVCSTFRSAVITGMYQTTIGAHHHRSSRGALKIHLPEGIRTIPELFREAGYFTTNANADGTRPGKEDYNFVYQRSDLYDGVDWTQRAAGQPFFAQYQLSGGKLRNSKKAYERVKAELDHLVTAEEVTLPPYYPDHAVIRNDWAEYLNSVMYTDRQVGQIIARLKAENVLENTVVFFLTDHGISHARGKQFLYEEGLKIPFVVWGLKYEPVGSVRDELISHIDLSATSLALAGIKIPAKMQGRPLFGPQARSRKYVVSARDRCDETVDHIRSVRKGHFKYIRNYLPERPYLQPCKYKDAKPFMPVLRELHAAGKLNAAQSLHLAETRPEEELYDLTRDPWEIHNLASDPAYGKQLTEFRGLLANWELETDDRGRFPESEAMYDSDMAPYFEKSRKRNPDQAAILEANIKLMKRWRAAGK
ncbi:sulfatase [Gimesia aquarii]|uniref:Arylsulfatase n=1 Tax=Gimesia aquarii TaxID=2527964 RepID=A0A517WN59_9PLAN|nr:sulfatase [Gimesia aquarii]QDU06675.1 Arylsulfatase [Gimesia aquarii]